MTAGELDKPVAVAAEPTPTPVETDAGLLRRMAAFWPCFRSIQSEDGDEP